MSICYENNEVRFLILSTEMERSINGYTTIKAKVESDKIDKEIILTVRLKHKDSNKTNIVREALLEKYYWHQVEQRQESKLKVGDLI